LNLRNTSLKATGTERLKLKNDGPISNSGFKFKLRRYTKVKDPEKYAWNPKEILAKIAVSGGPIHFEP